jgi:hypothetical protein
MAATVNTLVHVGMAPAAARLLGADGANGAPARMLQHVGIPAQQAQLLGTDQPGGGLNVSMLRLMAVGMPAAQARQLGV